MLRHAIAPSRRYTKASHDVVRHPRLSSDAKILLLYVQGLPEQQAGKALSEHGKKLGISGRAYQRAKAQLIAHGFVHEWKRQGDRGFWVTDQLFANVPLTDDEARAVRESWVGAVADRPGARNPAVGEPGCPVAGGYEPVEEELGENCSHPPSEEPGAAEAAQGERVLLSLRHAHPQLHLGVREARGLAEAAGEWIRRGVSAAELRRTLISELPRDGVRSAVGFLRHRLVQKLPAPVAVPAPAPPVAPPPAREFVVCEGEGEEHVFRPVGDETLCGPCAREANRVYWAARRAEMENEPDPLPWRERIAAIIESEQEQEREAEAGPSGVLVATHASGSVRDAGAGS
ncbi:hypothetical protein PUR34_36290 [Streptomyces sp. JV185]|uniref:hypothetical protein n=1 Tax=Streptomyces sp. JV185 TaxID=858638 RepID=UPI002E7AAA17|nr:hypothetical protein [Streptomyces sp. JV185]MEE1773482.1 hypothetical protein [Streptomyces sp. JV185]